MGQTRSIRRGLVIALCKVAVIVTAVIVCLLVGALSLDAHSDGQLVVAGLCAIAALGLAILGALWIFQSIRVLVETREK